MDTKTIHPALVPEEQSNDEQSEAEFVNSALYEERSEEEQKAFESRVDKVFSRFDQALKNLAK